MLVGQLDFLHDSRLSGGDVPDGEGLTRSLERHAVKAQATREHLAGDLLRGRFSGLASCTLTLNSPVVGRGSESGWDCCMGRPRQAVGRLLGPGDWSLEDAEDKGKRQGMTEAKATSWGYVD